MRQTRSEGETSVLRHAILREFWVKLIRRHVGERDYAVNDSR